MKLKELTGRQFGRLTVLSRGEDRIYTNGRKFVTWKCKCVCGTVKDITSASLLKGAVVSCGCFQKEKAAERGKTINLKHGQDHKGRPTPEYRAWCSMIQRCENPNASGYENYGGRGISISPAWRDDFMRFFEDIGPRPSEQHSLDRINGDGNYETGNCRWADKTTQSRNVRKSRQNTTGVKGVQKSSKGKYRATINVDYKSVFLGNFECVADAAKARKTAEKKYWGVDV